ncbi:hypothetical protein T09_13886 [Trichinella sp. T9]|nr:hypothetical protein T09_13886 [Trichinella sp. T9]
MDSTKQNSNTSTRHTGLGRNGYHRRFVEVSMLQWSYRPHRIGLYPRGLNGTGLFWPPLGRIEFHRFP